MFQISFGGVRCSRSHSALAVKLETLGEGVQGKTALHLITHTRSQPSRFNSVTK